MVQLEVNRRGGSIIRYLGIKCTWKDMFVKNISQKATTGSDHLNFISEIMKWIQSYSLGIWLSSLVPQTLCLPDKE